VLCELWPCVRPKNPKKKKKSEEKKNGKQNEKKTGCTWWGNYRFKLETMLVASVSKPLECWQA